MLVIYDIDIIRIKYWFIDFEKICYLYYMDEFYCI